MFALIFLAVFGLLTFAVRGAIQYKRTGSTGLVGLRGASTLVEWSGGLLFVIALALCLAGPALQLGGVLRSLAALHGEVDEDVGVLLSLVGLAITLGSQLAMGNSWRIGVDLSEQTELVTDGPFAIVRNPIFSGMIPAFVGVALLAPNLASIGGAVLMVVAVELHTRFIEEPHLARAHGESYIVYASRVGRFVPALGRLRLR